MPYSTLPTLSDGQILTASYLNSLSANQAFVFGVANVANIPFNSFSKLDNHIDQNDMIWYIRHRLAFLHWQVKASGGSWTSARIFYNGVKVADMGAGNLYTGTYNLASWAGLPNLLGAWASGVSYDNGFNGDGHVVTQGGAYYRCKVAHTSAASNQPGIGASWTTYWDLLTLPGIGTMCVIWVETSFGSNATTEVDYIVETDSASF